MIDYQVIKQLTSKYQTTEENVVREYLQHLFLQQFYSQPGSEFFLFKGGTSLRVVYQSPRFSEDIDFSGIENGVKYERILENILERMVLEGIECELVESKSTSGGWLAILRFLVFEKSIAVKNEVSFRKKQLAKETLFIASDFIPAYRVSLLSPQILIREKLSALLSRGKARDIFDLYFILRHTTLRKYLKISKSERERMCEFLKSQDEGVIKNELQYLLPATFSFVIKDLPKRLMNELE